MFPFLLTLVAVLGQALICVAANTDANNTINVNSSLHPDSRAGPTSWLSPSGRFAFGFYREGQRLSVGIKLYVSPADEPVVWTAGRNQSGLDINPISQDAVLFFTRQGFILTQHNRTENLTLIKFNGTESTGAAMLDNGNFMVYDSNPSTLMENCSSTSVRVRNVSKVSCITWQSFDHPTDTMMGGQVVACGTDFISRSNTTDNPFYKLSMQCDSNLVLYVVEINITADGNTTTDAMEIWSSHTSQWGYNTFSLSKDGNLFLRGQNVSDLILSPYKPIDNQANMLFLATLAPSKYFRLRALNLSTNQSDLTFEVPTSNEDCQNGKKCGVNSYCVAIADSVECRCLPGFNFTDSRAHDKGCQRSFAEPNCLLPGSSDTTISMEAVEKLFWLDEAYSITTAESEEACRSACREECECEAAIFSNEDCAKHKLPMIGATISTNVTTVASTAYIKIAVEGSGGEPNKKPSWLTYLLAVLLFGAIDAGVFLAVLVAGAGGYWLFYGRYRLLWRKWELAFQEEVAPRSFSYKELAKATNNFYTELGRGGHATVFKGDLAMYGRSKPVSVAVKRLGGEDGKGEDDFQAEIRIIGRANHVNLIRLLGFCYEKSNRLLVYECMSRGSLADLIYNSDLPSWKQRVGILLSVARGIYYLHCECETKIIHRDIKPENILIAENWRVKISDFGISKLLVGGRQATSTKRTSAPGTPGYVAPECVQSMGVNVTEKVDVYSFGIVVLETVFWERNTVDNNLLESAPKYFEDMEEKRRKKVELTDENLEEERIVKLGMLCVQENPDARPVMEDVILMLEGVLAVPSPAAGVTTQGITSRKKVSWVSSLK